MQLRSRVYCSEDPAVNSDRMRSEGKQTIQDPPGSWYLPSVANWHSLTIRLERHRFFSMLEGRGIAVKVNASHEGLLTQSG